jgi:hypothetical protein
MGTGSELHAAGFPPRKRTSNGEARSDAPIQATGVEDRSEEGEVNQSTQDGGEPPGGEVADVGTNCLLWSVAFDGRISGLLAATDGGSERPQPQSMLAGDCRPL